MYPTGFVSKRITGPKVSSSDGLRLFQSYLISFLCLSESWARRSTYVVSAESWGSSWTFWELWGPFIVFIVVHRKSSHHWPRRKHTVSKLHMWYTPLKKCYQAMWAWSFRQTVLLVRQNKSQQFDPPALRVDFDFFLLKGLNDKHIMERRDWTGA